MTGIDDIIWSSNSLKLIASTLRTSSNEIEADIALLRHCRSEEPQALRDNGRALLNDVLEQMEHAIRRLTGVSERALELARAVQLADTLFEETERDIQQRYEAIAELAEWTE